MISIVFYYILNTSISSIWICLLVLIIRWLIKDHLPKALLLFLWSLVMLRLVIPISITSPFSVMNMPFISYIKKVPVATSSAPNLNITFQNTLQLANNYQPFTYKTQELSHLMDFFAFFWISVLILMALSLLIYRVYLGKKLLSQPVSYFGSNLAEHFIRPIKVYHSTMVKGPAVFGVFTNHLILPLDYDLVNPSPDFKYVLLHEFAHMKRHDNLLKIIALFVASIHWFNPFAWLMVYLLIQDLEFGCDETVLRQLEPSEHKAYALALLSYAQKEQKTPLFSSGLQQGFFRKRIHYITDYQQFSKIMTVFSTLLCLILTVLLLTNRSI